MTTPATTAVLRPYGQDDDLCHAVCVDCYPDGNGPALCGADVSDLDGITCAGDCATLCVVCETVDCPRC